MWPIKYAVMKKLIYMLLFLLPALAFCGCSRHMSYADLKKAERGYISHWITEHNIKVLTEKEFYAQDSMTDVSKNEYVLFGESGIYMQIVNKGVGFRLESGDTRKILTKFTECLVETGDTTLTNLYSPSIVDAMMVTNKSGSYTAYFTEGYMSSSYEAAVPAGWMAPMPFIRLTRELDKIAKVRLILPHSQGHSSSTQSVVPYFYEISYELGR